MIRRLLACCLLLSCGACAAPPGLPHKSPMAEDRQTLRQLHQALQADRTATEDQALERFIADHAGDPWGNLARQFERLRVRTEQLQRENDQLAAQAKIQSGQNRQLQEKLHALQAQLDELTRSLIEQGARQP